MGRPLGREGEDDALVNAALALTGHLEQLVIGAVTTEELMTLKAEGGQLQQALHDSGLVPGGGNGGTPEPSAPPEIAALTPDSGPDGGEVALTGNYFGVQGDNCKVTIGGQECPIAAWNMSEIVVVAVQGQLAPDLPWPVIVTVEDGQTSSVSPAPGFTFTAAEAGTAQTSKKKSGKHAAA